MIDADHFKKINDKYGHLAGDKALKKLAEIVKISIRKQDSFARFGGEEFVILMPEEEAYGAVELAERIRKAVEICPISIAGKVFNYTVSMGIAGYSDTDNNFDNLLNRADKALYQAKIKGRNSVVVDEMDVVTDEAKNDVG